MKVWTWALLAAALVAVGASYYGWRAAQRVETALAALDEQVSDTDVASATLVAQLGAAISSFGPDGPLPREPRRPADGEYETVAGPFFVVDGDTFDDAAGIRYRLVDIDAPDHRGRARCEAEALLAEHATERLRALLADAPSLAIARVEVQRANGSFRERVVVRARRDATDLGDELISARLAKETAGTSFAWCERR